MQGWWRRDPFFVRYMMREVTAFAVLVYAIMLMVGVVRLAQGEAAWNGWLAALRSPGSILLHLVLLVSFAVHAQQLVRDHAQDHADDVRRRAARRRLDHHAHRLGRDGRRDRSLVLAHCLVVRMNDELKRSNAPIFWLLFGAGGMLSALFGTALVFITGIAAPLGWPFGPQPAELPARARVLAELDRQGLRSSRVIALFAWHAVHRIYHSLHDLGIPTGALAKLVCYGGALLITVVAAYSLLSIGF